MKAHNFYAGPSILPKSAVKATAKAIKNFANTGMSLASISHRSKEFEAVVNEAVALFKELLNIPEGYEVLFLGGGASMQFAMIPMNLMKKKAVYVNTGVWSTKAMKEAKLFGEVVEVKGEDFYHIPKGYSIDPEADYIHVTTNNTIYGTEIFEDINSPIPLVADMSSDIFSRPIDVSKYALIYGGAQKNLAPAGVSFVIVKSEILGKVDRVIPSMLKYETHIKDGSMYNTPPCIPIFTALQTLKWIKKEGGVEAMQKKAQKKAELLYNEIDKNKVFKATVADPDRSLMNICFVMKDEYKDKEAEFSKFAAERGLIGLKGHRLVGGFRASTYNALPKASVKALVKAMQEFEKQIIK